MAYSKVGFITGVGGNPTGIGQFVQELDAAGIPAVVMANDTTTGLSDIWNLSSEVPHVMVFRVVRDGSEQYAVPNYNLTPVDAAWDHWNLIKPFFPPEVTAHKDTVWIQPINEVDKNRSDWLGWFAKSLALYANGEGYKVAMFAFASGEPEPEHWRTPGMLAYLQYCHENHDMAGVALHEYDYAMEGMHNVFPYHVGRFLELFEACEEHQISRPLTFITEWGWTYTNIPSQEQCMADVAFAAALYAGYEEVMGAGMWYLGPGFSDIANKVQKLITPVKNYNLTTTFPDPLPEPEQDNFLINPSFELGWYHPNGIPELQIPNDWELWYAPESEPNPYDTNPWSVWRRPEVRTLPKSALPPSEQELFVLHGNYTLKSFKGHGSIYWSLGQWIPQGSWQLEINVYPDLVISYDPKVFATDPNACIIWAEINGTLKSQESRPRAGEWSTITFDIDLDAPGFVEVFSMQPFALANNGIFADKWRLTKAMDEVPYKVVVNLLPQDTTKIEKGQVLDIVHESKETILQSADDAARLVAPGKPGSKVKVWGKERWQDNIVAWLHAHGVALVEEWEFPADNPFLSRPTQ